MSTREPLLTRDDRLALACVLIGFVAGLAFVLLAQALEAI